jgi:hypothetical protein
MQTSNLSLHLGATRVSREQLAAIPLPVGTNSWRPLAHHRLLEGVETALNHAGLRTVTESHGLAREGNRYFGLLQVANGENAEDFGLVVGLRNSHDQSFPAGLVVGSTVFVCDNLSFYGEVTIARRHTAQIQRDLPQLIDRAVGQLGDLRRSQAERFAAYKQHELTESAAHDLVIQAIDARVVPVTKIPEVLREWRSPRHSEFRDGGRTGWRFLNAVTETLKGSNIAELPKRCTALHGLLDAHCGLAVSRN